MVLFCWKDDMRKRVFFCVAVVCMFLLSSEIASAKLSAYGDLKYSDTTTTAGSFTTSTSSLSQTYYLNFKSNITRTISLSGSMSWIIVDVGGITSSREFGPHFSFSFSPPDVRLGRIFSMGYSRSDKAPFDDDHTTNNSLYANLDIPKGKFWPQSAVTLNRSWKYDHQSPRRLDRVNTNLGFKTSASVRLFGKTTHLSYAYRAGLSEDLISGVDGFSYGHNIAITPPSVSLLDGKASLGTSFNYSISGDEYDSPGRATRFDRDVAAVDGLSCFACVGPLTTGEGALIDNNTVSSFDPVSTVAVDTINLNVANWHIGAGFAVPEAIHRIYVDIDTSVLTPAEETLISTNIASFGWQLYVSPDNNTWTSWGVSVFYDTLNNRFEFNFSEVSSLYFKVLNTGGFGGTPINVSEIELVGFLLASPRETYSRSSWSTSLGLGVNYRPVERLSLGYNLNYAHNVDENDDTFDRISNSFRLNYQVVPKFLNLSSGLSFSSNSSGATGTDIGSRSFSLGLNGRILPTLNGSLSYGLSENIRNGKTTSEGSSYRLTTSMKLYPGINMSLYTSNTVTETAALFGSSQAETDSTTHGGNLTLIPWRFMRISSNYQNSEVTTKKLGTTTTTTRDSSSSNISLSPTRTVHVSLRTVHLPESSYTYALSIVPPLRNIHVGLTFNDATKGVSLRFVWRASRWLRVETGYSTFTSGGTTADTIHLKVNFNII